MLGLKMSKPENCMFCPVRMECINYKAWLFNPGLPKKRIPKPLKDPNCLLVDLDYLEDDLK